MPTPAGLRQIAGPALVPLLAAAEAQARAEACPLWAVGGAVRDLALGRPLRDLDLVLAGDAGAFAAAVAARVPGARVSAEARFATATVATPAARLDLAAMRTERYRRPGALPEVALTDAIDLDLARRDFSVNTIALGLAGGVRGRVVDPHGGLEDLAARRLRLLHARSLEDDATRIWRGARTAASCDLTPDADTSTLLRAGLPYASTISGVRWWNELAFTAARGHVLPVLRLLDAWGLFEGIVPGWHLATPSDRALRRRPGALPAERLAACLLAPLPARDAILDRLAVSREVRTLVADAARLLDAGGVSPTMTVVAALEGTTVEARLVARWLDPAHQHELQRELGRWERTRPWLDAGTLRHEGVTAGPEIGRWLSDLRRARFLGTLRSPAEARRAVRERTAD